MSENIISQEQKRKIDWWKEKGIEPYGRKFLKQDIYQILENQTGEVSIAGRIMGIRKHGKAAFCDISDASGKIQAYLKKDIIGEPLWENFKNLDIGDIVGIQGELFKTHTEQLTILIKNFILLSKNLRSLPEKWHGLKDIEIRYRKRYLDLIMNHDVKNIFITRTKILSLIREFLNNKNFIEVETPMMHPIVGGAQAKPFITHHNALDIDLYLRIAPELYLKRLLVGGMENVYEINRSFRNEGISTLHNPEFTMLEAYSAYKDCEEMINLTEEILIYIIEKIYGKTEFIYQEKNINFQKPWKRILWTDIWKEIGINQWDNYQEVKNKAIEYHLEIEGNENVYDLLDLIFSKKIQTQFIQPTFVIGYPKEISPLAKSYKDNPDITERFELYISGLEVANAYSELNDPVEQEKRFQEEVKKATPDRPKTVDQDYIETLEYGMPPAGGLGIGIDRMVMLLTNSSSIRDVILFPLLKQKT